MSMPDCVQWVHLPFTYISGSMLLKDMKNLILVITVVGLTGNLSARCHMAILKKRQRSMEEQEAIDELEQVLGEFSLTNLHFNSITCIIHIEMPIFKYIHPKNLYILKYLSK